MKFDLFGRKKIAQLQRTIGEIQTVVANERRFNAATPRSYNHDFLNSALKTNADIRKHGDGLRNGSRNMAKNNCDYRRYLAMCERNIVGSTGFKLQMNVRLMNGKKDDAACRYLEGLYGDFSKVGNCTANRRHSMRTFCKLCIRNWRIDGEIFIRRLRGFENKSRYAFQLLDPAACPLWYSDTAPNGNRIRMGIEYDAWDAPVAYYFQTAQSDADEWLGYEPVIESPQDGRFVRIPAEEINHFYTEEFTGQRRGFPFGQAAMQCLNLLDSYYYVELVAADSSSRKLGKMINKTINQAIYGGRESGDGAGAGTGGNSPQVVNADPGSWDVLTGDWDMKMYDPQHPAGNFPPFVKAEKRNIANGLDVAYNTLANDLENVNFSSIRSGVLDEREAWMDAQETFIEQVLEVEFRHWLEMQFFRPDFRYDVSAMERICRPVFLGRRWPWVDPKKDAESSALQIALGATTPQDVAANLGNDFDENVEAIAEAVEKLAPVRELLKSFQELSAILGVPGKAKAAPGSDDANADDGTE